MTTSLSAAPIRIRPELPDNSTAPGLEKRAVPPVETLSGIMPHLRRLGITRIADITDLDIIGIPVALAVRPNSRSNAVFQGKGLTPVLAKVSALMEAVETYHAENIFSPLRFVSTRELASKYPVVRVRDLPRDAQDRYHPDLDILWIEGTNIFDGSPLWLPYECVHSNFTLPYPPGSGCFLSSTNGLASGNNSDEALRQAICEVIERDATSIFLETVKHRDSCRVSIEEVQHPILAGLNRQFSDAGIAIAVWDITSDLKVPVFRCLLFEKENGPGLLPYPAEGSGCAPNRDVALLRALLEAAQVRLTVIAGTRDDIRLDTYLRDEERGRMKLWWETASDSAPQQRLQDVPWCEFASVQEEVAWLLSKLASAGFSQVVSVDLTPEPELPYSVIRVVIPGLEGLNEAGFVPGRRIRDAWQENR